MGAVRARELLQGLRVRPRDEEHSGCVPKEGGRQADDGQTVEHRSATADHGGTAAGWRMRHRKRNTQADKKVLN